MASGSFEKVFHNSYKLIVEWASTATTSSNSSVVTATVKLYCPYSLSITARSGNTVDINGTSYSFSSSAISTSGGTTHTLGTVTSGSITHNGDGTKSVSITANFNLNATLSGTYYGTQTASATVELDKIPRASSISCSDGTIGQAVSIVIKKADDNFTHTLTWSASTLSGTIVTKTNATTYGWIIPTSLYNVIDSGATRVKVLVNCYTYDGSTEVGSTSISFWAYADSTDKPLLNPTIEDTNSTTIALTGDKNTLVKYYSNVSYTIGATAQNGATIASQYISCGSQKKTTESGTINNVVSGTFTVSATDSRGYTNTVDCYKNMVEYVKLTCYMEAQKPTTSGTTTITINGRYFNGSFGSSSNTLTVQYRYSVNGGSYTSWTSVTPTKSGNDYSVSKTISGLNYQNTYKFEARAIDKLMTVTGTSNSVRTETVFDWSSTDFNFNVPVTVNGDITADGVYFTDGQGNEEIATRSNGDLRLGFDNYVQSGADTLVYGNNIKCYTVNDFTINGNSVLDLFNASSSVTVAAGTWTPKVNLMTSYTQRYGNYIKIGNMCTISFCIVGTASSSGDTIQITGLPFTPNSSFKWQAGGGNFANGYTNANSAFAGYVIENGNAIIYARSTGISSTKGDRTSGYIGAQSGTTIYMSGTIMYRTT